MITSILTPEQLRELTTQSDDPALLQAEKVASASIWRHLGALEGEDLAYVVGVVERYGHDGGSRLYLRRRPVSSVTSITVYDQFNNLVDTIETTSFSVPEPARGYVMSPRLPDTQAFGLIGYEYRRMGTPLPLIQVTYTGGWVTRAQVQDDATLVENIPEPIEEACAIQTMHLWNSRSRDRSITSEGQESSNVTFRQPMLRGGLLSEVKSLITPYIRRSSMVV